MDANEIELVKLLRRITDAVESIAISLEKTRDPELVVVENPKEVPSHQPRGFFKCPDCHYVYSSDLYHTCPNCIQKKIDEV